MMERNRIKQLDSLRFFAISLIILSHFEFLKESIIGDFYWKYLHNATFGVDYFFILSGFGLYYSLSDKEISYTLKDSVIFAIKKIRKIYPLYLFSLVICIPYYLIYTEISIKTLFFKFCIALTLLQSAFCSTRISHSVNGVCWFLSSLFICYLFVPRLIVFIKKICLNIRRCLIALFINIVLIVVLYAIFIWIESYLSNSYQNSAINLINDLSYGSPYFRILFITLGMILANIIIYLRESDYKKELSLFEVIITILVLFWFLFRNTFYKYSLIVRLIDILLVNSFIIVFALGSGFLSKNLESSRILFKLGGGYGMYFFLLHYPIRMLVGEFVKTTPLYQYKYGFIAEVFIILGLTIIICICCKIISDYIKCRKNDEIKEN